MLVVDNAEQPMLAGPLAALTQIVETGNVAKLHLLFTHLDGVTGANLRGYSARISHVRESVDNAIRSIETSTSAAAARALARRAETSLYFAGRVDRLMSGDTTFALKGSEEFARLARDLQGEDERRDHGDAKVVVARRGVALAVRAAAQRFQEVWLVRVGADRPVPGGTVKPEHWSRVKALTRRIANDMADHYLDLKPVADFRRELQSVLYEMVQDPVRWQGRPVEGQEKQEILDSVANAMTSHVMWLAEKRVITDRRNAWNGAYELSGTGSTSLRTRLLADEVITRSAPVPAANLSDEAAELISEVEQLLDTVAAEHSLVLE